MRVVALALAGGLLFTVPVAAQFGVSAEVGLGFIGGTDRDTSAANLGSLRPYRPTQFTLRPEWRFGGREGRFAVGLGSPTRGQRSGSKGR